MARVKASTWIAALGLTIIVVPVVLLLIAAARDISAWLWSDEAGALLLGKFQVVAAPLTHHLLETLVSCPLTPMKPHGRSSRSRSTRFLHSSRGWSVRRLHRPSRRRAGPLM